LSYKRKSLWGQPILQPCAGLRCVSTWANCLQAHDSACLEGQYDAQANGSIVKVVPKERFV